MPETIDVTRTRAPKSERIQTALMNPYAVERELCSRSLFDFLIYFWDEVSAHEFKPNWHIEYLCQQLEELAMLVGDKKPRLNDLIINVPPGSTKTITCSIMYPVWCWTKWHWMRFITASYSGTLSLESADYSRELIRSQKFKEMYPELSIKEDKDTKSNFRIVKRVITDFGNPKIFPGGNRYSTSVGGTLTGFHGDILIIDDPLNPTQSASETELANANHWMEQTLPTRKTDKAMTPTILIMQRLHQNDPSGHALAKQKKNIKHISLPGECRLYADQVKPPELKDKYVDDLLDPKRMPWVVLKDLESDLGQYGYAGQIGQNPSPPGGGMFKVDMFQVLTTPPRHFEYIKSVRYWDKAGTEGGGAFTVGVKISYLKSGKWIVEDVIRGQWAAERREMIIRRTAEADGEKVYVYIEQEPGSGGLESAEGTIRNLAGYAVYADKPTGDKVFRADPYSVQVNGGNFLMLHGRWNIDFIEEHRFFPVGTYKDQVDAAAGAFNKLIKKRVAGRIT